ncbi:hypothetical protein [Leptolyngbya sp. BC1307]|uniref:hypothetical protein n=1 Tax=Leptolyngbya sp. BC1307 TaxID=2029589 RepID=UPI000EFBE048|nr:hypothetical protein [Leptolyngbya sp. BC1307]
MTAPQHPALKTLEEGLTFHTVDELKKLLQRLPIRDKPTRKAELVDAIAQYLRSPNLKKLWKDLNELQQSAVAEAVYVTGGRYLPEQFQAKYGQLPEWDTRSSFYRYGRSAELLDLFFYPLSNYYGVGDVLPEDLRLKLKAFVPEPQALTLKSTDQPPESIQVKYLSYDYPTRKRVRTVEAVSVVRCPTEQAAQQDLLAVLRLVHLGKVSVSDKTLMPGKAALKAIAPLLQGGDYYSETDQPKDTDAIGDIKPFAWVMLLQGGGLAQLKGKKLELTRAGQKAMGADPAKTIQVIWKKWLKTTLLDELRRTETIKGQTGKGKRGLTAVGGRRKHIVDVLSQCPTERWITYEDLKQYLIASGQGFEISRSPENLYISEPGYGYLYDTSSWSILQDAYLRCFLFEYAATLGLIDVAYAAPYEVPQSEFHQLWGADDYSFLSRYDGLLAFRINPLGAFCMGLADSYTAAPVTVESTLRVLPNLDIVMTGPPLSPAEALMMETFTSQTSDAVWKLDRETALKAAEAGHALSEFQDFLSRASAEAFPKTVEQFFKDCRSRSESLQDKGIARLIECADATLAALIAHDSRTKKYCQLAGEKHLVVLLDQETRFRNGLRKLGYSLPLSQQ